MKKLGLKFIIFIVLEMTLIGCKNPVKTQPALQTQVTNTSKENDCLHQKENDKAGVIRENFEYYNFYKLKKEDLKNRHEIFT